MTIGDDVYQELYGLIEKAATPLKAIEVATELVPVSLVITPINKNALYLLALGRVLEREYILNPSSNSYVGDGLLDALETIQKSTDKVLICEACGTLVDSVKQGHGNAGLDYTAHYLTALHRLRNMYREAQQ